MNADAIKLFFDGNAIFIMFVWGLICKYVPKLKAVPNSTIPWVNLLGYILFKLAVPAAGAASGLTTVVPDLIGVAIGGFTSAIWARQLYEGFGRSLIEKLLKIKKETV